MRTILHVDMDAFFASVETRDEPSLRGKPVLVGGAGKRGVVAAASYEARAYGCRSAQPMAHARRLCPQAVIVAPRHEVYVEESRRIFAVFRRFSPLVEALSIDEAFLDVSGSERLLGSGRDVADSIRREVRHETGLTCSVGIASVKFIAKIASGMHKPDGVTEVPAGRELEFLGPLPIGMLWGVGPKAEKRLRGHGITTIGALRAADPILLERWFGSHGAQLHRLSQALDARVVVSGREAKSIGHENTCAEDIVGLEAIRQRLLDQAVRVADRLVTSGLRGRTVHLKIRDGAFVTETRQCTLPEPTHDARVIYDAVCRLLDSVEVRGRGFRLTGVGVADFSRFEQLSLLEIEKGSRDDGRVQQVMTTIRDRFGHQALYPASAGGGTGESDTGAATGRPIADRREPPPLPKLNRRVR